MGSIHSPCFNPCLNRMQTIGISEVYPGGYRLCRYGLR
uniref:Uncharacterized protein n=1 Tax=Decurrovirus sp. TaxID=2832697 RepID=A0AAU8HXH9_9CAUD